jgi:hypothetical protein
VPLADSLKPTVLVEIDEASTLAPNCTNSGGADVPGPGVAAGYAVSPSFGVVLTGRFTQTVALALAVQPSGLVTATVYIVDNLGFTVGWAVVGPDRAHVGRSQVQA